MHEEKEHTTVGKISQRELTGRIVLDAAVWPENFWGGNLFVPIPRCQ